MFVETGMPAARVVTFEMTTLSPILVLCPTLFSYKLVNLVYKNISINKLNAA